MLNTLHAVFVVTFFQPGFRKVIIVSALSLLTACGGGSSGGGTSSSTSSGPSSSTPSGGNGGSGGVSAPDESGPASSEMLNNPGFDSQGNTWAVTAPGWVYYTPPNASASYALDTNESHGGGNSQRVSVASGETAFMQGPIAVREGVKYGIAVWLKASKPTRVQLVLHRASDGFAYAAKTVIVQADWKQYGFYGYTENTNGQFTIKVKEPGQVWIDDATMIAWASPLRPYSSASQTIPLTFFGQHMHQHNNSASWPAVPFGTRRLWDTSATWADIASCSQVRSDGTCAVAIQYNWNYLDAKVNEAQAHGAEILLTLARTPQWASARPSEASPYGNGQSAEPKNDQTWRDWVTQVATRYRGRIKYWEIWNEPNFHWNADSHSFYTGTPEKLLSLQQQAYEILKRIDGSNVVLTPGFTDLDYLEYYLSIGGGYSADVIAYHFYVLGAPEAIYRHYARTVQLLAKEKSPGLPVWNTEQGWIGSPIEQNLGAAYLARSYILNWASGVGRYYWYAWDNSTMAVQTTQSDGVSMTPAGVAYGQIEEWLIGQQLADLTIDGDGNWIARLNDPSGNRGTSYIVWNPGQTSGNRTFTVPGDWQVSRVKGLTGGGASAVPGQGIAVNYSPLLLSR